MHPFICDFLLDIVQNSFEVKAPHVTLTLDEHDRMLNCVVKDDGKGMSEEVKKRAVDPFYTDGVKHRERKVGLGLPFLAQEMEEAGGTFRLSSEVGKGTEVAFGFDLDNIDTPPMGDLPGTLLLLFTDPRARNEEFTVVRNLATEKGRKGYTVSRSDLKDAMGGDLSDSGNMLLIRQFLASQEESLDPVRVGHPLDYGLQKE